jgi:hypothetical protein
LAAAGPFLHPGLTQLSHHFGSGDLKVVEFRHSAKGLPICGAKLA